MYAAPALFLVSFVPLSLLVLDQPSTSIAIYSLGITTLGGLIAQYLRGREHDRQRAADANTLQFQRNWDLQDRADHRAAVEKAIAENTEITRQAAKAAALLGTAQAVQANQNVHVLESALDSNSEKTEANTRAIDKKAA